MGNPMRLNLHLAALGAAIALTGCNWLAGPADEYQLTADEALAKLSAVSIDGAKRSFYGTMGITASKVHPRQVKWVSSNGTAYYECLLGLAPVGDQQTATKVTVKCNGGGAGDGAAAGMTHNMFRNRLIELVDATLRGQPIEKSKGIASRWPGDGVDGSPIKAAGAAIKMDQEMRDSLAEAEERQADRASADPIDFGGEEPAPVE
jgi:hypothetical protein